MAGDYLRDDYLKVLHKTRSPWQAGKPGGPLMIRVQPQAGKWFLTPIFNFHEGDYHFILGTDAALTSQEGRTEKPVWTLTDHFHFRLGYERNPEHEYTFVGDLDRYLRDLTIAGEYVDASGNRYSFGSDGWAYFPKSRFQYQVGADHVFSSFDYLMVQKKVDSSEADFYGFIKDGDVLSIFETSGELNDKMSDRPRFVLRRCCESTETK